MSDCCLIPLTQGQFAKVDAADYQWLNLWKWHAAWSPETQSFYAKRMDRVLPGLPRELIQMHRILLCLILGDKRTGDHINGNTLDNRRINLRVATHMEQQWNRRNFRSSRSGFKGVTLSHGKWQATISVNGEGRHLGTFLSEVEAHAAYRDAELLFRGRRSIR